MTSARVVIFGLVGAVLAGGVVGVLLGGAVAGPATGFSAGTATAAVAAAVVGFVVALLMLRPGRSAAAQAPAENEAPRPRGTSAAPAAVPPAWVSTDAPPAPDELRFAQSPQDEGDDGPAAPAAAASTAPAVGRRDAVAESDRARGVTSDGALVPEAILLDGMAGDRDAAIDEVGRLLVDTGAVDEAYIESMRVRENSVSTFMGSQLAIPHGTTAGKSLIRRSAVAVVRYPESITWHGNPVRYVVAIAGAGDDHLKLVSKVAEVFLDAQAVAALENARSSGDVLRVFAGLNAKR